MRQEEKKISSWRDLTMKQLALLMRDYAVDEQGQLRREWEDFRELVRQKEDYQNGFYMMWIGAYFLTFAAMYHEKKETGVSKIEFKYIEEDIAEKYHLNLIARGFSNRLSGYSEQIRLLSNTHSPNDCVALLSFYLEHVSSLQVTESSEIKAANAFYYLFENNKKKYPDETPHWKNRQNNIEKRMGLEGKYFFECLDSWNVGQLWANYQKYQEIRDNPFARKAEKRLRNGIKQLIFTGAPGTGKTYIAKLIAGYMGARLPMTEKVEEGAYYTLVQFHPSYDYTDFVEGLRPVRIKDQNAVNFVKLDGQFKTFCRMVAEANVEDAKQGVKWEDKKYFFLIDEINRAELSKVFGELMYGLEADKRGPENRMQTQYQNLPAYNLQNQEFRTKEKDIFWDGFFIPSNVIVIGTMNEIDRSAESMDFALRRRFEFMEAVVSEKTLEEAFRNFGGVLADNRKELAKSVNSLNKEGLEGLGRKYNLDRQYFISQGQFANLPADEAATLKGVKNYVWEYRVKHLLREYLRGEPEDSIREFVDACRDKFFQSGEYDPQYSDEEP